MLYMSGSICCDMHKKQYVSEDLKAGCCSIELTDAQLWTKIRTPTCSSWPASTEYVGEVFQLMLCWETRTGSGVLGQHLQQRGASVSGWEVFPTQVPVKSHISASGAPLFTWDLFPWNVLLNIGRIYVPYFWILIRTRYYLSCGFTALLVQMWVSAGVQLRGRGLCAIKIRCS